MGINSSNCFSNRKKRKRKANTKNILIKKKYKKSKDIEYVHSKIPTVAVDCLELKNNNLTPII